MIKAFIFDLDGTLVHALPDIQANINQALENLGHKMRLSLEETQPHVGGGAHKLASNVLGLPMDDERVMALYHEFADVYEKNPASHGYPFPQVMDTLKKLQQRGIKLSVVTAKPAKARLKVLTMMGFDPLLVAALSPEDGYNKKPAPDMLIECCQRMGVDPSETWMVGDTLFDVEAGLNAKCAGVGFTMHGYQDVPEKYKDQVTEIHNFSEILNLR
ncbi:MAG: HAD-IA family hydrolase [Mariprofundaceae bacterium]|nr:HAD-IA family hydrolase [Mariprofundaceae bacterium]